MSSRVGLRRWLSLLLVFLAVIASAQQVTVDYGSRSSPSAKPIPAGVISAQLGFLQSTGGLGLLQRAGFRQMRLDAQLSNVFLSNSTPNWTVIDPVLLLLSQQRLEPMIVVDYTPGWLQQTPNPCPVGTAAYHAPPRDIGQWAALAAQFVHHVNTSFPGLITDYEIWNEPDIPNGLCAADDTTRLNTYLAMYAAAATAMRAQAAQDGAPIRVGGPAAVNLTTTWIPALLSNSGTSGLVDFVSYHKYLGYINLINNGLSWDGNTTSKLRDLIHNFGDSQNAIAALVRSGSQPNPSSTPIYITEYNDDAAFLQDCCRNDPTYSPLFNAITVASLMNTVYAGAQGVPARLHYFSASTSSGFFCLVGVLDSAMDCSTSGGPLQPYPQYYAYQMLAASNFLNMAAGGNMAVSASLGAPLQGFGFYTSAGDALVLVNPNNADLNGVSLTLQNTGSVASNGVVYLLNAANEPITSSTIALTPSGNTFTGTVNIPAYSVVGVALGSTSGSEIVVSVSPTSADLRTNGTQQFNATVSGTSNTAVTWSVDGTAGGNLSTGTITTSGLYTAPSSAAAPSHIVTATSVADTSKSGNAQVTVESPVVVSVSPTSATVVQGRQQTFVASVSHAANTQVNWSVDGIPNGSGAVGTITSAGVYTAPNSAGPHTITATSQQDPTASASAAVNVVAQVTVAISPTSASLVPGQSQSFTATVNNATDPSVVWSVDGIAGGSSTVGTVSSSGVYTAPAATGQHTVTATSVADSSQSASAQVTVTAAQGFTLSSPAPTSATIPAGQSAVFKLTVSASGGFAGTVQFSCSGAPQQAVCSPSPATATLGSSPTTVTYTVTTSARTASAALLPMSGVGWWAMGGLLLLPLARRFGVMDTRRSRLMVAIVAAALLLSCGGGGSSSPPASGGTPAGTYTLTLAATSGSTTHSTPVTLTVR